MARQAQPPIKLGRATVATSWEGAQIDLFFCLQEGKTAEQP